MGNIVTLNNAAPGATHGLGGPVTEGFGYDGLYRLTNATGLYTGGFDTSTGQSFASKYTLAMTYDTNHNILKKNQTVQGSTGECH